MQNTNGRNDLAQLAKGVHSLCQNKNAHSLGLKSHLKRLQFHTMFDVYDHSVDRMYIQQTLHTKTFCGTNKFYPHYHYGTQEYHIFY